MKKNSLGPTATVGNDFILPKPVLRVAISEGPAPVFHVPAQIFSEVEYVEAIKPALAKPNPKLSLDLIYTYSFIIFALLSLLIGSLAIKIGANYYLAHKNIVLKAQPSISASKSFSGINMAIEASQLDVTIQKLTSQPANLNVGDQSLPLSSTTIKNWLSITPNATKSSYNIHVKQNAIAASLLALAQKFAKNPVDQVSINHDGTDTVVVAGHNGLKLTDPTTLNSQAVQAARGLLSGQGLNFSTPTGVVNYAALTPANFNKLIEVNVVTKQMYLYDNGQLTRSYPISAGAPATPTPIGEFHIFSKFATEDMKGTNPNGTPYFQPHVHWINYFLPGGYAVHGNYWRPLSWFGVINSSHGCVSLPDDQAQWVYNWAPLGTTVITRT